MTWDDRLNVDQRHVLWRAWDDQRAHPVIDVPREEYFSSGLDRFLDPHSGLENGVHIDSESVSIK